MTTVDNLLDEREDLLERSRELSELITTSYRYSTNLPDRDLLVQQLKVMMEYLSILNQRIKVLVG